MFSFLIKWHTQCVHYNYYLVFITEIWQGLHSCSPVYLYCIISTIFVESLIELSMKKHDSLCCMCFTVKLFSSSESWMHLNNITNKYTITFIKTKTACSFKTHVKHFYAIKISLDIKTVCPLITFLNINLGAIYNCV